VWETLHRELAPAGIDIVTVCLDVEGVAGATPDLVAARDAVGELTHIAVVDRAHVVDELFGIVNVPMGVWIDEDLRIVRPAEFASPGIVERGGAAQLPDEIPDRMVAMAATAGRIRVERTHFLDGLHDWAANGADSAWVLDAEAVLAGSTERSIDHARAAAHFELGQHLHRTGHSDASIGHFREAHRLDPGNWTYKRQAWELASRIDGPYGRFWQGPLPGAEDDWPYDGDWLTDIEALGPEHYYPPSAGTRP
jgi:hypothetical protein